MNKLGQAGMLCAVFAAGVFITKEMGAPPQAQSVVCFAGNKAMYQIPRVEVLDGPNPWRFRAADGEVTTDMRCIVMPAKPAPEPKPAPAPAPEKAKE